MFGFAVLYRNKNNDSVLVQRCARHPIGAIAEIGDAVMISAPELSTRLVAELLTSVDAFDSRTFDESLVKCLNTTEQRAFVRSHCRVSVTRKEDGTLELLPSRQEQSGYLSKDEHKLCLSRETNETELYKAILHAFAVAE